MDDMELVFYNCRLYNGTESDVGKIGVAVQQEYLEMTKQLYFEFYQQGAAGASAATATCQ